MGGEIARVGDAVNLWCAGFIANRNDLLAAAELPSSATDAEILRELLHRYGTGAARRIAGPFSWVLWDAAGSRLLAARDRAGSSGIFYSECGGQVVVGNRVRQIRTQLQKPASLNLRALVAQMHGRAPLPGETCFRAIKALEPGALLVVSAHSLRVERFWRLEAGPILRLSSDAEYAEAFRELLFTVVAEYCPKWPSAISLSGGLDSTSVAAALAATGGEVAAFTFGTPELPDSDETPNAAATARQLDLPLEVIRADLLWPLSGPDGLRTLEEGPLLLYRELWEALYARLRQLGIQVLFTGSSGDHLLGGTGVLLYPDLLLRGRWLELAGQLREHRGLNGWSLARIIDRHLLRSLARAFLPHRWEVARKRVPWLGERVRGLLRQALPPAEGRWRMLPGRRLRLGALHDTVLPHASSLAALNAGEHGIELRHPLTDHRLMEFAAGLPLEQCFRSGIAKVILRNAMRGFLPDSVVDLRSRVLPLALFERGVKGREQAKVRELITNMRAAELVLVDERRLQLAYERYLERSGSTLFWHTLTLEDWLRRYV